MVEAAPNRLWGTPGNRDAVRWLVRELESIGVSSIRRQAFTAPVWRREPGASVTHLESGASYRALALGGSTSTPRNGLTAKAHVVRCVEDVTTGVRGQMVIAALSMDSGVADPFEAYTAVRSQRETMVEAAVDHGAAAMICGSLSFADDDEPHAGWTRAGAGAGIPVVTLANPSLDSLIARCEGSDPGLPRVRLTVVVSDHAASAAGVSVV